MRGSGATGTASQDVEFPGISVPVTSSAEARRESVI